MYYCICYGLVIIPFLFIIKEGREEVKKVAKAEVKKQAKEKAKHLTKKQRELLNLVFRFRFVTASLVADYYGQPQISGIWVRLEKLVALGMLTKRYDGRYKIHGRSAEYYVTPVARHELRRVANQTEREIKQLYSRPMASDRFVTNCLSLLSIRNQLSRRYGQRLMYMTKVQLNLEKYDYLPKPLPDAYLRLDKSHGPEGSYFLDYFDDAVSLGIHARRLNLYHQYKEDGEWDGTDADFPVILAVCQSRGLAKRLIRRARHFISSEYSDIKVRVVALDDLVAQTGPKWAIWTDPEHEADGKVAL